MRGRGASNILLTRRQLFQLLHKHYPIASFTWLLFYENPQDKAHAKVMVDFMKWALTDGQKFATELGYSPLPKAVVDLEMKALTKIKIQ